MERFQDASPATQGRFLGKTIATNAGSFVFGVRGAASHHCRALERRLAGQALEQDAGEGKTSARASTAPWPASFPAPCTRRFPRRHRARPLNFSASPSIKLRVLSPQPARLPCLSPVGGLGGAPRSVEPSTRTVREIAAPLRVDEKRPSPARQSGLGSLAFKGRGPGGSRRATSKIGSTTQEAASRRVIGSGDHE